MAIRRAKAGKTVQSKDYKPGFWHYFDLLVALVAPGLSVFLLVTLDLMPLGQSGWSEYFAFLSLSVVFFWWVYYPQGLPLWLVCLFFLVQDAGSSMVLGGRVAIVLILYGVLTLAQRYIAQISFGLLWVGQAVTVIAAALFLWILHFLIWGVEAGFKPLFGAALVAILLYPCMAFVLSGYRKILIFHSLPDEKGRW